MAITLLHQNVLPKSLSEFENWTPEDGFKYEWNDGNILKFYGKQPEQAYIYSILLNLFYERNYHQIGSLLGEIDIHLSGIQMRRPDVAFYTKAQLTSMGVGHVNLPEFVVEIISNNDNINLVKDKVLEYLKAGIKVIWLIYPYNQTVESYNLINNQHQLKLLKDQDICSADPVLEYFTIKVSDLLRLPITK